jgi:spore coat polysaccharide biosynthesis predicted glycosyltransferase SpsG
MESPEIDRNARSALLALGGDPHGRALELTLEALKTLPSIQHIEILASPMGVPIAPAQFVHQRQQFVIHKDVPSVAPLLRRAGVVIASHGNLAYEAMALGAPLCLIGQKPFQAALAGRLSDQGLAVNTGLAALISADDLAASISQTLEQAAQLTMRARQHIDGRGLERISTLLWRELDSSTEERCDARVRFA